MRLLTLPPPPPSLPPAAGELWRWGLCDARAIVDGDVAVHRGGGRREASVRVMRRPGPSLFVKGADHAGDRWLDHEREVLERLATQGRPLHGLAPEPVPLPHAPEVLVTELIPGTANLAVLQSSEGVAPPEVAAAIGRALARVHALPAGLAPESPAGGLPPALGMARPGIAEYRALSEAGVQALALAQQSGLCDLVADLAGDWSPRCLMHGDVRPANILVGRSPLAVHLIDWEFAGPGDPRWDVGSVIGHALHLWADSLDAEADGPAERLTKLPAADVGRFVQSFWAGYGTAGGRASGGPGDLLTAVRFAGAALFEIALGYGDQALGLTRLQRVHLQLALNVLTAPQAAATRLLGLPAVAPA